MSEFKQKRKMSSKSRKSVWIIRDCKVSCSIHSKPLVYLPPERLGELLNSLDDGLLAEILCRLPLKDVHRNKSVCRRWSALISSAYFARRFTQHSSSQHPLMPLALLPRSAKFFNDHFIWTDQSIAPALGLSIQVFGAAGFSLSFLPDPENILVNNVSRDLLMCSNYHSGMDYIVNPLTKNWVALPMLPPNPLYGWTSCLICDHPDKDDDCNSRNVVLATDYKYKVVRILDLEPRILDLEPNSPDFELQVFSSESGRWNSSIVSVGARWIVHYNAPVICNGNVHLLTRDHGILICDLSSKKINDHNDDPPAAALRFLNRPTDAAQDFISCSSLGVYRGRLRTCNVIDLQGTPKLRVWELVDYDSGDWKLEYEVYMNEITPAPEDRQPPMINNNNNNKGSSNLQERVRVLDKRDFLGLYTKTVFHPHLGNVIYVCVFFSHLFRCNLQSKTFEEISWTGGMGMFPYILPRWPTPVPNPFPTPPFNALANSRRRSRRPRLLFNF